MTATRIPRMFAFVLAVSSSGLVSGCGGEAPAPAPRVESGTSSGVFAERLTPSPAEPPDPAEIRAADVSILFVGNSHTGMHDLPGLVAGMIRHRRPNASVRVQYVPVAFLEDAANSPSCREEIEKRPWRHVVLQAQKISMSGRVEYSREEGIALAKSARERGASVLFYPEWGLKGVARDGPRQEKVYREMARTAEVAVAPVARAWDAALAERPDLALHSSDGNHQSQLGAFLTACVLYGRISGESPAPLAGYAYPHANEDERKFLSEVAARILDQEAAEARKPSP